MISWSFLITNCRWKCTVTPKNGKILNSFFQWFKSFYFNTAVYEFIYFHTPWLPFNLWKITSFTTHHHSLRRFDAYVFELFKSNESEKKMKTRERENNGNKSAKRSWNSLWPWHLRHFKLVHVCMIDILNAHELQTHIQMWHNWKKWGDKTNAKNWTKWNWRWATATTDAEWLCWFTSEFWRSLKL